MFHTNVTPYIQSLKQKVINTDFLMQITPADKYFSSPQVIQMLQNAFLNTFELIDRHEIRIQNTRTYLMWLTSFQLQTPKEISETYVKILLLITKKSIIAQVDFDSQIQIIQNITELMIVMYKDGKFEAKENLEKIYHNLFLNTQFEQI